jgi:hypothetical protein
MAEMSVVFTLTTPGPDITFNAGSGDEYFLDPQMCSGLDGAPVRTTIDDAPQTPGGIVFPAVKGPRHVVLGGILLNRTGTAASRNTMEDNLVAALDAIAGADGTLAGTPSGGSARSLTVRLEIPVAFPAWTGFPFHKQFVFGLVAADPDW